VKNKKFPISNNLKISVIDQKKINKENKLVSTHFYSKPVMAKSISCIFGVTQK